MRGGERPGGVIPHATSPAGSVAAVLQLNEARVELMLRQRLGQ